MRLDYYYDDGAISNYGKVVLDHEDASVKKLNGVVVDEATKHT